MYSSLSAHIYLKATATLFAVFAADRARRKSLIGIENGCFYGCILALTGWLLFYSAGLRLTLSFPVTRSTDTSIPSCSSSSVFATPVGSFLRR